MHSHQGCLDQLIVIRNNDFFSEITDEEFDAMDLVHHFKETPKNEYIYFETHLNRSLYFLKNGYVKIGFHDKDGNEVVKEIIGRGDIFGQITLLPGNAEGEFAQAYKSDVSLCMFRIDDFQHLLKKKPELALRFTRQVGEKLSRIESRMMNLLQRDVRSRLLYFFSSLTRQFPSHMSENRFSMENILTHDDVARLIASTRQTVTTMLSQLQQEDLIVFSRKQLEIPDVKKLQKLLTVG
jgi:CRP/FNR family transcriptional regulator